MACSKNPPPTRAACVCPDTKSGILRTSLGLCSETHLGPQAASPRGGPERGQCLQGDERIPSTGQWEVFGGTWKRWEESGQVFQPLKL